MSIGGNLRKMRKSRGLTLNQLADRITYAGGRRFSACTISAWERSEKSIDAQYIPILASALDCSIASFYEERTPTPDEEIRSIIMTEEYESLSHNEQEIIYNAFTQWNGNIHALIQMVGIYISLPPASRSDISVMSIIKFEKTEEKTEFAKLVDLDFINEEWLYLARRKGSD